MNITKLLLLIFCVSCASSPRLKPFSERVFICKDSIKHEECKKSVSEHDNIDLHTHDPREIDNIEVPY